MRNKNGKVYIKNGKIYIKNGKIYIKNGKIYIKNGKIYIKNIYCSCSCFVSVFLLKFYNFFTHTFIIPNEFFSIQVLFEIMAARMGLG